MSFSRRWAPLVLSAGLGCASLLAFSENAGAVGLMSTGARPIEQRLALSVAPERTTLWSQLRLEGRAGEIAIVLPVNDGASLDWGSRAFFESLEVASAPRVIPPEGAPAVCPGDEPEPLAHVIGDVTGSAPLEPIEALVLDDAAAVETWASGHGLTISPGLEVALQTAGAVRFLVARFSAPGGLSLTKALRVVTPAGAPVVPLVLTQAGADPVDVVLWSVGDGRAVFDGTPALIDTSALVFDVGEVTSNYRALAALALGTQGALLFQMASHESLRDTIPASEGGPDIDSVVRTYFSRAATYGEVTGNADTCTTAVAVVLGQSARVGTTCPRTTLGVVGGGAPCTADVIETGEVDPALLRCGLLADDLAVLLSDQVAQAAWLTRAAARIPAGGVGANKNVTFQGEERLDPIVSANSIDLSNCDSTGEGGMSSGPSSGAGTPNGSGPSAGSGSGTVVDVPVYAYDGCACGGEYIVIDYEEVDADEAPDGYYVDEGDGCSSDSSDTYVDDDYSSSAPDDCSGESYDAGDTAYDDGCGCDTADAESIDGDGCSCDAADSGGADSCDCGEGIDATGDSCGGEDCAVKGQRRPRRINRIVYLVIAIVIPIRRLSRPKRLKRA